MVKAPGVVLNYLVGRTAPHCQTIVLEHFSAKSHSLRYIVGFPDNVTQRSLTLFYRQSLPTCHMALHWLLYDLGCTHTGSVPL